MAPLRVAEAGTALGLVEPEMVTDAHVRLLRKLMDEKRTIAAAGIGGHERA